MKDKHGKEVHRANNAEANPYPAMTTDALESTAYYRVIPAANAGAEEAHSIWHLQPGEVLASVPNGPFLSVWKGRLINGDMTDEARDALIAQLIEAGAIVEMIDKPAEV